MNIKLQLVLVMFIKSGKSKKQNPKLAKKKREFVLDAKFIHTLAQREKMEI